MEVLHGVRVGNEAALSLKVFIKMPKEEMNESLISTVLA